MFDNKQHRILIHLSILRRRFKVLKWSDVRTDGHIQIIEYLHYKKVLIFVEPSSKKCVKAKFDEYQMSKHKTRTETSMTKIKRNIKIA